MDDEGKLIHFPRRRVLYFGMSGFLSRIPLAKMLAAGINICGVVLPTSVLPPYLHPENGRFQTHIPQNNQSLLLSPHPDILHLAAQHQIRVTAVAHLRHPEIIAEIQQYNPDLICVSCFDQKFPRSVLNIPRDGCLNLHPSLLPQLRGPSPLFWTFQQGVQNTGVTLHFMNSELDSGDILLQAKKQVTDGMSGNETEISLANLGAELFIQAIQQEDKYLPHPQTGDASYFPMPTDADFELKREWTARHAFNFMRGTAEWQRPYFVQYLGEKVWLQTAVSYQQNAKQPKPIQSQDGNITIQFSDGVLTALPARH